MATVTELITRVQQLTRLATTGTELTLVTDCLNDAYAQAVMDTEVMRTTSSALSLTSGTTNYVIGSSPFNLTDLMAIRYITASGDGVNNRLLERVSEQEILALGQGAVGGPVCKYAVPAPNAIIFWGSPASGVTVTVSYVQSPKTLVASAPSAGQESTPTAFPARFHYELLATLACALCFEYDGQADQAAFYRSQYDRGLQKFTAWSERFGGNMSPSAIPQNFTPDGQPRYPYRDDQW